MKYKVLFLILLLIIPCIIIVGRHFYAPTRHRFFLKTDVESSSFTEFPLPASMAIVQQSAVSFNEDKMVIAGCESNNLKIYTCDFLGNKLKDKFILFS
ncbi:MAG: hypothetical protein LBU65_16325, partial [Planctomycetaceae bacterium]|nr:hypothetical protein [Planctomycetaceae bacterium]